MIAMPLQSNLIQLEQDTPHVLVVDDEISNRQLISRILKNHARMTEAGDGQQALALLEQEAFDLVLLDIMMPGQTGLEVLKIIRENPKTADLPVILVSALTDNDNVVQGLQIGANDYILKPIDIDVMRARVNTQLRLKMMQDVDKRVITELEAAQQMKDRLFKIASHDLKAPLANVKMIETLIREYVDNPAAIELLDLLRLTVNNMKHVIEEFLDTAAYQNGNLEIHMDYVDVQQVVTEVAEQFTITAQEKDITLEVGEITGIIFADQRRLAQILTNLVSNALKYTPKQTTVRVWSEVRDHKVRINIADQGPGIPVNERGKLFKEFSKLSSRPTAGESSTGLGLWIVKQMVMLQNGIVDVDCPPDGGSIFWVEFPVYVG
jgi:two-component system, sensor histidine kinase and response regulator